MAEEDEDEYAGEEDLSEEGEDWDEMESRLQKGAKPFCLRVERCLQCQPDLMSVTRCCAAEDTNFKRSGGYDDGDDRPKKKNRR